MAYSLEQRELAVRIANQYDTVSGAMDEIRTALGSASLQEKTVRRWLSQGAHQTTLNDRQKLFLMYYLESFNATKAAIQAGYSERSAHTTGYELLKNPEIQKAKEAYLEKAAMSANEVLNRLSHHASGDLSDFIGLSEFEIKQHPKAWLLKKYKRTVNRRRDGEEEERIEIELHDPQSALVQLGRYYQLFTDKSEVDVTSDGKHIFNADALNEATRKAIEELGNWKPDDSAG